ncbi:MAG: hypothetical protein ACK4IA_03705 [Paracoccus hibiscisoli]|uniref:hypothetical protein n=1 Tax=Paracoccus hibiscisoli TaxID=2023261 RepID=UPI003919EBE6
MTITISAHENFGNQLDRWLSHDDRADPVGAELARLDFVHACKILWNDTGVIPQALWHDVRDAIDNWKDADDWEASGHKYSVAARHIVPRLQKLTT